MTSTATVPALWDPDVFTSGPPHEIPRRAAPHRAGHWQDMPDEPGFWAVLKHEDLTRRRQQPVLFSASEGGVVLENLTPERPRRDAQHAADDGPAAPHRLPPADGRAFKARVIGGMEGRIRAICREIFDQVDTAGGSGADVEFVHDVAGNLPSQVVGELVGIPREDWAQIRRWAEMTRAGRTPRSSATAT